MTEVECSEETLIERLLPLVRDLSFVRPQLQAHYDAWIGARNLQDGPACFAHAVVSTGADSDLIPAQDRAALCLALAALIHPQAIAEYFASTVPAGLFSPALEHNGHSGERWVGD